ncbi:MAG TPA: hypothetical protein VMT30_06620 [Candidatus Saccharimonadia bacterium]|nr:hypothetical protein [Candidatus Saccharimonadia bacterium]
MSVLIKLDAPPTVPRDLLAHLAGRLLHKLVEGLDHSPLGPSESPVRQLPYRKLLQAIGFELGRQRFNADRRNPDRPYLRYLDYVKEPSELSSAEFGHEVIEALRIAGEQKLTLSTSGAIRVRETEIIDDRWFRDHPKLVRFADRAITLSVTNNFLPEPLLRFIENSRARVIVTDIPSLGLRGAGFWLSPNAKPSTEFLDPPFGYVRVSLADREVDDVVDVIIEQLENWPWFQRQLALAQF